jgi:hypothetical protein
MAKTKVELPKVLHLKVRVKAALEGRSVNDIVVTAVQRNLHSFRRNLCCCNFMQKVVK